MTNLQKECCLTVINKNGSIKYISNQMDLYVVASPIYISGIPFKIQVRFEYNPVVTLKKENLVVSDDNTQIYPYTVSNVNLSSLSTIGTNGFAKISKLITEKYSKLHCFDDRAKKAEAELHGECRDSKSSIIKYTINANSAEIEYLGDATIYENLLAYTNNLTTLKNRIIEKLPDLGSGL